MYQVKRSGKNVTASSILDLNTATTATASRSRTTRAPRSRATSSSFYLPAQEAVDFFAASSASAPCCAGNTRCSAHPARHLHPGRGRSRLIGEISAGGAWSAPARRSPNGARTGSNRRACRSTCRRTTSPAPTSSPATTEAFRAQRAGSRPVRDRDHLESISDGNPTTAGVAGQVSYVQPSALPSTTSAPAIGARTRGNLLVSLKIDRSFVRDLEGPMTNWIISAIPASHAGFDLDTRNEEGRTRSRRTRCAYSLRRHAGLSAPGRPAPAADAYGLADQSRAAFPALTRWGHSPNSAGPHRLAKGWQKGRRKTGKEEQKTKAGKCRPSRVRTPRLRARVCVLLQGQDPLDQRLPARGPKFPNIPLLSHTARKLQSGFNSGASVRFWGKRP